MAPLFLCQESLNVYFRSWPRDLVLLVHLLCGDKEASYYIPAARKLERILEGLFCVLWEKVNKLDGVGPVDNRPSTN